MSIKVLTKTSNRGNFCSEPMLYKGGGKVAKKKEYTEFIDWNRLVYDEHNRKILVARFELSETATREEIMQDYLSRRPKPSVKVYRGFGVAIPRQAPSNLDKRRLGKGARASMLPDPTTREESEQQIEQLDEAIIALQSMDDLGTPEANQSAWQQMLDLQKRQNDLRARIF